MTNKVVILGQGSPLSGQASADVESQQAIIDAQNGDGWNLVSTAVVNGTIYGYFEKA